MLVFGGVHTRPTPKIELDFGSEVFLRPFPDLIFQVLSLFLFYQGGYTPEI